MNSTFRRLGPSELLPRYIFAEGLFARRRVLEVGAVASTGGRSAEFLAARGARSVLACDCDLAAVEAAQKSLGGPNLHFRANVFDDLESKSFDLALIADLSDYARAPELVRELRRLLDDAGFLVGGLRNPAGLALSQLVEPEGSDSPPTYGQLLDALAPHFRHIEAATQSPVLGYQVAFERGEGLQIDGTFASAGEAAYFVVVAGQEPCRMIDPTWVQLPPEPLAYMGSRVDEYSRRSYELADRSARLKQALEKARSDLALREAELSRANAQLEQLRQESARAWAELQTAKNGGAGIAERDELAARVRRLESEIGAAIERATQAEARTARHQEQLETAQRSKGELESQLLAATESARLERLRRDEVAKLLEDSGSRLARGRDDLRSAHDDASAIRLELQRARAVNLEMQEKMSAGQYEVDAARERELRLADEVSRLSAEAESLKDEAEQGRAADARAQAQLSLARGELEAALRASAADSEALRQAREAMQEELQRAQTQSSSEEAAEAQLATALAEVARLSRELEAASAAGKRLQRVAADLEAKLAEARDLSGIDSLKRELEEQRARAQRLETDVSAAVATERATRERSEMALAEAQANFAQVEADRDQLRSQVTELQAAQEELRRTLERETSATEERQSALREQIEQLNSDLDRAEQEAAASTRAMDSLRIDAELAADRDADRERHATELSGRLRQLEGMLEEVSGRLAAGEREKSELAQRLEVAGVDSSSVRSRLEAQLSAHEQEKAELAAVIARLRGDLAAERTRRTRAEQAHEQGLAAQASAAGLAQELKELEDRLESAGSESRILAGERLRLSAQVEHLEAERARMAEKLDAAEAERKSLRQLAEGARAREAELSGALADRQGKLEIFQRRLAAQDSELAALRRSFGRSPPTQVQQIYERASAELSAVKAELFRKPADPSGGAAGGSPPSASAASTPSPPGPALQSRKPRSSEPGPPRSSPAPGAPRNTSSAPNQAPRAVPAQPETGSSGAAEIGPKKG